MTVTWRYRLTLAENTRETTKRGTHTGAGVDEDYRLSDWAESSASRSTVLVIS
ncbi:hypothetical protein SAMN05216226_106154 [Halovenus aranensis]|uniref:Uncharacterized protein n=1 Tax=Halovenus aranensis TaxID=890420 RepID=A0A1G8VFP0_9EURY|nr:hypothetical protein SAMN05216226_106154 [Halovenus aranensis]